MISFQDYMGNLARGLPLEVKKVVEHVLAAEHKRRFGNRDDLPETYATAALRVAKAAMKAAQAKETDR